MTNQITLEEALELVDFFKDFTGTWRVTTVKGSCGKVEGEVFTTINGRKWQYIETPRERLVRLAQDGATKEQLLEAVNQMEMEDN